MITSMICSLWHAMNSIFHVSIFQPLDDLWSNFKIIGIKSKHFLKEKKTILKQMSTVENQTCKKKLSNNNMINTLVKYQSTKKKKKRQNKKKPFFNLTTEGNFHYLFPHKLQH